MAQDPRTPAAGAVASTTSKLGAVLRVTSGNFLEQFDFFLFGFYATYISKAFFPAGSDFASLMLTFAVFGAGFLMRPLGAIVLGAYIDKVGRRKGLIVTLAIMASGTILIAFVPGYATIGLLRAGARADRAPAAGLFGRGGTRRRVGLPGRDGDAGPQGLLYRVAVGQPAGRDRASPRRSALRSTIMLTRTRPAHWGWRIPFFIGCMIVPFIFVLRRSLQETEEFQARTHHPSTSRGVRSRWRATGDRARRHAAGRDDDDHLLPDHRLHADLRQDGAEPEHARQPDRHAAASACRTSSGCRSAARCRTASAASRCLLASPSLAILTAYPALDVARARRRASAACSTVLLWFSFLFGMLQRRDGRGADRGDAGGGARRRASRWPTASRRRCSAASRRRSRPG